MRSRVVTWLSAVTVCLVVAGLAASGAAEARSVRATAPVRNAEAAATQLRVMTFNIEEGGTHVSFANVVKAIHKADADVVTVNEAFGNTRRLAGRLGWRYVAPRLSVVSRLPLLDPAGADGRYLFVQPQPDTVVAITTVHLPSWPGNTDRILAGATKRRVMRTERNVRLPAITPTLAALRPVVAAGIPALVQGDLNSPSFQDWTPDTVGTFPQIKFPMAWPVSVALSEAGFTDAYRVTHPDPVTDPGITWPAKRPRLPGSWNPPRNAPRDRIDAIWSAGPMTAVDAQVVGEPGAADLVVNPWPSDHRAVVATFDVDPIHTPVTVSVLTPLTTIGRDDSRVHVTANTGAAQGAKLLVVPKGYAAGRDLGPRPSQALLVRNLATSDHDQRLALAARRLGPGAYDAVVVDGWSVELARTSFWVRRVGDRPAVRTRAVVRPGQPLIVRFARSAGNQWDWVGIYERGADDPTADYYLNWAHTGATTAGVVRLAQREDGDSVWPLPAGRYTALLLIDDSYRAVAWTHFVVRAR